MNKLSSFTSAVLVLIFLTIGVSLLVFSVHFVSLEGVTRVIEYGYTLPNLRIGIGIAGILIILMSWLITQFSISRIQREKTIAFDNPDGQVVLSLTAIEDFIKRVAQQVPDIKELKPNVVATKKGIDITNRVMLYSDSNIPEVTERIQGLLKNKIQNILGIEETISIRVHIAKVVDRQSPKAPVIKGEETKAPFKGIEYSTE